MNAEAALSDHVIEAEEAGGASVDEALVNAEAALRDQVIEAEGRAQRQPQAHLAVPLGGHMLRCRCAVSETTTAPHYRWSRAEYDRAIEAGVFGPDARLELVEGAILAMGPQGSRHFTGIELVVDALRGAFGPGYRVRTQGPLAAGEDSEPEPDVAVVAGDARAYRDAHPATALLVVEVSDNSLHTDRTVKQRLYARCGIPEYWILALPDRRLEVHRDPAADGYRSVSVHRAGETVSPLGRPGAAIAVDSLLP